VAQPSVSIVIPVWNGADYLREAVDSALAQTYDAIEVVVVNDGSDDGGATETIALSYGDRIRYFAKENGGVATALNLGIEKMTGEYFSWLSHDDAYYPHKVASQVEWIGDRGGDTVPYCDFDIINASSKHLRSALLPDVEPKFLRPALIESPYLHGCTLLVHRKLFEEFGTFDPTLPTTQDYALWFRMARTVNFVHQTERLVRVREHAAQGIRTMQREDEVTAFNISALDDLTEAELDYRGSPALTYYRLGIALRQTGRTTAARHAFALYGNCGETIPLRRRIAFRVSSLMAKPRVVLGNLKGRLLKLREKRVRSS
jgi:glycosyltransferase involved in cell wall biosynthesis